MLKIVIDLKESADAHHFFDPSKESETHTRIVHKRQFELVTGWIKERIERLGELDDLGPIDFKDTQEENRPHDTITILGTRGSGKTSFLLSIREKYKKSKIAVLKIIDPTLIEEKGHVFLNIVSMIKDEVNKKLDTRSCVPGDQYYTAKTAWNKLIEELAHGLPSMDGVGGGLTESNWQDPEYIMQRGLRSVSSARDLEKNFGKFVKGSLEMLGKKAFLIAFDDIDVDFKKGWPVLETIRKYLTSPHIITLLSGDLRLYSMSIRKHQWENFGETILKNEGDRLNKTSTFNELVTEMEGQYLQKILKPERRIILITPNEMLNSPHYKKDAGGKNNNIPPDGPAQLPITNLVDGPEKQPDLSFYIVVKTVEKETEIKTFYDTILSAYAIKNPYQAEAYRSFLMSLPLRTQIRFLSANDTDDKPLRIRTIISVFFNNLYEKRVDMTLADANPKFLNVIILELLLRDQVLNDAYQLQPTTTDTSLNCSLTTLSFLFATHVEYTKPYLIFDYFIRVGYVRNLLFLLGYLKDQEEKNRSRFTPSIEGLCNHSGIRSDKVLRDITGLMTAYVVAYFKGTDIDVNSSWGGIIELKGLSKPARRTIPDRIDTVFGKLPEGSTQKALAYFPLSVCKNPSGQQSTVVYSFYTLLGAIGEMIRKVKEGDVEKGVLELSQIRFYQMPDFKKQISGSTSILIDDEDNERGGIGIQKDAGMGLEKLMQEWHDSFPPKPVSPHLLGKISSRTYYAFESIGDNEKTEKLAGAIHFRIIAFMNAVLIEDVKENVEKPKKLNIDNTNYSERIFISNLSANIDNKEVLSLSRWILSCPMLLCYLDPENELKEALSSFCEYPFVKACFETSIYRQLSEVSTKATTVASGNRTITTITREDKKFVDIIAELRARNIPFSFFEINDRKQNGINNKAIKTSLPKALFEKHFEPFGKIRHFRRYLAKRGIRW